MNLNQLKVFVTIVENKGISAASRALNLSPAAVSKQLKSLEDDLNVQLVQRTSTQFHMTEVGDMFYTQCIRLLNEMSDLKDVAQSYGKEPVGELKVFCTSAFGEMFIIPHIQEFYETYPKVLLTLDIYDRIPDIQKEGIDLAFGLIGHWDQNLVQKKLLTSRPGIYAAPSYIKSHGAPKTRTDLRDHHFICHSNRPEPMIINFTKGDPILVKPSIFVNSHHSLIACATNGLGLVYLYDFMAKTYTENGQLKEILQEENVDKSNFYGFYASTHYMKPALRAMLDFIAAKMGNAPY